MNRREIKLFIYRKFVENMRFFFYLCQNACTTMKNKDTKILHIYSLEAWQPNDGDKASCERAFNYCVIKRKTLVSESACFFLLFQRAGVFSLSIYFFFFVF